MHSRFFSIILLLLCLDLVGCAILPPRLVFVDAFTLKILNVKIYMMGLCIIEDIPDTFHLLPKAVVAHLREDSIFHSRDNAWPS